MDRNLGSRAARAAARIIARPALLAATACALALAGCNHNGPSNMLAAHPRGATIAFESIDGPPARQFHKLVRDLNEQAQARRLAVISRDQFSAYRVRGYLAAKVARDHTTISWVWDVFDSDERRALRITGEETAKGRHRDAWNAADDAMLQRIARSSMAQLAAFLSSPEVAPGTTPATGELVARAGTRDSSPEAAGIFRIFRPDADPVAGQTAEVSAADTADPLPPPRRRPQTAAAAVSDRETLTLSAASR